MQHDVEDQRDRYALTLTDLLEFHNVRVMEAHVVMYFTLHVLADLQQRMHTMSK